MLVVRVLGGIGHRPGAGVAMCAGGAWGIMFGPQAAPPLVGESDGEGIMSLPHVPGGISHTGDLPPHSLPASNPYACPIV